LGKLFLRVLPVLLVAVLVSFPVLVGSNGQRVSGLTSEPTSVPPSLTLLGAGARWAAQNGSSTLFINWEDNYLTHGNTDGVNWGPWPTETDMKNATDSITYALNQSGLNVTLAGDIPSDLAGYNLLVIEAYWAVAPTNLAGVRDFIAGGGGVVILEGVPEFFRTYCKDWWTYRCQTDNLSLGMDEIFACDGDYFNTGGYANVSVDNPFNTALMSGDTLFEGTGCSFASVLNPYSGSQVIAQWNPSLYNLGDYDLTVAFAYTYQYGLGRVYYQAAFTPLDPPDRILGDINIDGKVGLIDLVVLANAYDSQPGDLKWNPGADLNFNGIVNLSDLVILASHYGQS
jgi:hypothetical protein